MVKEFENIDLSTLPEEVQHHFQMMKLALMESQKDIKKAQDNVLHFDQHVRMLKEKNASICKEKEILVQEHSSLIQEKENLSQEKEKLLHEKETLLHEKEALTESTKIAQEKAAFLEEENERLRRMIQKRVMQLYGVKSEKLGIEQLPLFSEPALLVSHELSLEVEDPAAEAAAESSSTSSKTKKPSRGKAIDPNLERRDIMVDLETHEKICNCCGTQKSLIGQEVSEKIGIIPLKIYVNRYHRQKYACRVCEEGVKIASHEPVLLPKCMAEPSLLAHIITAKYVDHLPLYRQEAILERVGIPLSRGTLCTWTLKVADALKPLCDHIHKKIVESDYVQADETPLQVLNEPDRKAQSKSYMWLYKSGIEGYVLYDYQPTREGKHPSRMLKGFKGYLQKDAYSGYNEISHQKGVISVMCWAHARRKFHEVQQLTQSKKGFAADMLKMIGQLYKVEREVKGLKPEEIKIIRKRRCPEILTQIHDKLEHGCQISPPKSDIGKAIHYTLSNWKELTQYIEDGRIHIDNNAAERMIKPFVTGRKNWLFNQNERGAKAGAILFSLMESAKAHGVNPQAYLEFVIQKLTTTPNLDDLLPESYKKTLPDSNQS